MDDDGVLMLEPRADFDPALIGIVRQFNREFAVYSESKVLEILANQFADDEDPDLAAREFYEFNIAGAWVGEATPAFLMDEPFE